MGTSHRLAGTANSVDVADRTDWSCVGKKQRKHAAGAGEEGWGAHPGNGEEGWGRNGEEGWRRTNDTSVRMARHGACLADLSFGRQSRPWHHLSTQVLIRSHRVLRILRRLCCLHFFISVTSAWRDRICPPSCPTAVIIDCIDDMSIWSCVAMSADSVVCVLGKREVCTGTCVLFGTSGGRSGTKT